MILPLLDKGEWSGYFFYYVIVHLVQICTRF
uniref:Uncharacterized protein n=1 Tax=Setaria viridis TaxID=4556 RepID=A0A4U6W647_SETVI|nr:hypothetical protein SEVIR_1G090150v2 [Setaria viridis]